MIKFIKYYWLYFLISAIFIVPGIYSLFRWGLKLSIDFTGGTIIELKVDNKNFDKNIFEQVAGQENLKIESIRKINDQTYQLQTQEINQDQNVDFQKKLASVSGSLIVENKFETLGPSLGSEMLKKALAGVTLATFGILFFVWRQFKDKKYGICAILAMLHDTLIIFGIFSILGHFKAIEVDTLFMTAVLTILSFSVHDTIVVYDRIRESIRNLPKEKYEDIIDKTINETLGRSVNNSMTIIFMLLCLYLLGGETIKWFIFALLIGTVSGTYSSTFTAAPLLVLWDKVFKKK